MKRIIAAVVLAFGFTAAVTAQKPVPGTEAVDKPSCPPEGKSKLKDDRKADDEARNLAKRYVAKDTPPVILSIADLKDLQADTDPQASIGVHKVLPRELKQKHAGTHLVSEGDRISVTGYLHRAEEGSNSESVNCAGKDGRDIHLNINKTKPVTEYNEWTGIVAEVAPQVLLPGWTSKDHAKVLKALQAVQAADLPVLAIGSLTYDNGHQVNSDKNHPKGTNPKRISLWEVHPVLEFYVCPKGKSCDPAASGPGWQALKKWSEEHLPKKPK